ncbi:MAG: hypothetical protein QMD14_01390 [Candidatus Aenigmarchaeota archaeon]|nr:hypothetical protein [Candidatus Aenigmarchaeota archaeon]
MNKMRLDLVGIAREALKDKKAVIENLNDNKVKVSYINENLGPQSQPIPIIFPRFIKLDEEFAEGIGLYLGDGYFAKNNFRNVCLVSKDSEIIVFMLNFFLNRFNLKKFQMLFSLTYKYGNEEELKEKWSRLLKISKNRIHIYRGNKHGKETSRIEISFTVFRRVFQQVINSSLPLIKQSKNLRQAFLRGEFAADGSISVEKIPNGKRIIMVTFSFNLKTENFYRNYVKECLELEGINRIKIKKDNRNREYLQVTGWDNYIKLWKMNLFSLLCRKKKLFDVVLKRIDIYLKLEENFRKSLFETLNLRYREIAKIINNKSKDNIGKFIRGKSLLKLEQIKNLIEKVNFDWNSVIYNTKSIRVGRRAHISKDKEFLEKIIVERKLI